MDRTETYIKMRIKAIPELGVGTPPTLPSHSISKDIWVDSIGNWYFGNLKGIIFCQLERQDALQEMVLPDPNAKDAWGDPIERDSKVDSSFWLAQDFTKATQERKRSQQSMEQLWLRYVMEKKYNKIWDGEEWIKIDNP